ncbi:TRAP-type C4-dicarboxylate transport system permease small subunit [Sphingomonas zeicaulis]|uniref:TRAP transporter small permease n=1 Tax=Sphingomonas zeicaulis TaxID=1632740 RepID=UPI003D1BA3B0
MSDPVTDAAPGHGSDHGEEPPPAPTRGFAARLSFYLGSAGLLIAMATDATAVLGRHTGFALLGAIEIVQAAIVLITAASMVSVTLGRGHAAVHILTERLSKQRAHRLQRVAALLGALTIALLIAGSAILLSDLWGGHERSELLHIPLRWFRALMIAALAFILILFVRQAMAGRRGDDA